jgi:cytochrome c biogenesis protein CcmG/thiol:disulfide interchange protein DsbE
MKTISATVLVITLTISYSAFGQKRYYKNGKIIEDSVTYIANKEKDKAKYEMFAKPVIVNDHLELLRSNTDSIIFSYTRDIKVGKQIDETKVFERETLSGKEFPLPELTTITGDKISIQTLKGKPTMINLWFTSCAPCISEMPVLNKLKSKYGESVNFISLISDSKENVDKFLKKREFNFIHIVAEKYIADQLKITSFPTNIFLDRDGKVSEIKDGVPYVVDGNNEPKIGDGKEFEVIIDRLLRMDR